MPSEFQKIFSVGELNENVHRLISAQLKDIFVKGEISNLAQPASGHIYFSLKDKNAQVRCALFRNRALQTKMSLENGLEIIIHGTPSIYTVRGDYQIIVDYLETAGEGLLRRRFEELKQKLLKEGLFESSMKRPIPKWPRAIGVITSPTGAAIRDVLSVINRRCPSIPVIIYPCQVQGENASATIIDAIQTANRRNECDSLILTRGGGSLEDLWAFNEESTARAIADSRIPILSAVGHETDFTISDMVADIRAATPSAGAELASPDRAQAALIFHSIKMRFRKAIELLLKEKYNRLKDNKNSLISPENKLLVNLQLNDELGRKLYEVVNNKIKNANLKLSYLNTSLIQIKPNKILATHIESIYELRAMLKSFFKQKIQVFRHKNETATAVLNSNNPKNILKRGYSITHDENDNIISSAANLSENSKITTTLHSGKVVSKIDKVIK